MSAGVPVPMPRCIVRWVCVCVLDLIQRQCDLMIYDDWLSLCGENKSFIFLLTFNTQTRRSVSILSPWCTLHWRIRAFYLPHNKVTLIQWRISILLKVGGKKLESHNVSWKSTCALHKFMSRKKAAESDIFRKVERQRWKWLFKCDSPLTPINELFQSSHRRFRQECFGKVFLFALSLLRVKFSLLRVKLPGNKRKKKIHGYLKFVGWLFFVWLLNLLMCFMCQIIKMACYDL